MALSQEATLTQTTSDPNPNIQTTSEVINPDINVIGRVASPPQLESTSDQFHFWVQRDRLVEKTQIVRTESRVDGKMLQFYGVIDEVRRRSRKRDINEEFDGSDGDVNYESEFKAEGVTYASVSILHTDPTVLTPPIEQSKVYLGGEAEADASYGFSEMVRPLLVGRLRNGGNNFAGLAKIDLAYLLGDNSGHLNVTGMAGAGTKSSFLMVVTKSLLHEAQRASGQKPLYIVPIILNVKGEDLMWIDRDNRDFDEKKHGEDWRMIGIEPGPFEGTKFYAPTEPNSDGAPTIDGCNAEAYAWSLADVVANGLFPYLFSEDDVSRTMIALVYDIVAFLTKVDGKKLKPDVPQTWQALLEWIREQASKKEADRDIVMHQTGTWRAIYRRLWDVLAEGESIFLREAKSGQPLNVKRQKSSPPLVVDIHNLTPSLQRFVVATIVKQVVDARTGRHATPRLRYLLVLDELNRFAPRNSGDAITKLLERVASEMRSQGIILFGAQQFASQVSTKIIENSAIRVLGRTGSAELQDKVWQSWDKSAKRQASVLRPEEKLVIQPTFRQPMFVKVPFPAWAMRREDIAAKPLNELPEV